MANKQRVSDKKKPIQEKPKRKIEKPTYKTLRLQKRIKHDADPVMSAYKLMKANIQHLLKFKRLFLGISVWYFLLSLVLVSGLVGSTDYSELKGTLTQIFKGTGGQVTTGFTLFGVLISSGAGKVSEAGSVYQSTLLVVVSLVVIWALRQTYAKKQVTTKQAFYKSMMPLVPFVLVLIVIGLQFIPLVISSTIYSIVITSGLAVTNIERVLWGIFMLCFIILTLYMVTSSIFALYIVTLPDMSPMQALRSARELVRYRRWSIMRKVIFLPFCLVILAAVIMVPVLLFLTFAAQWLFIFLTMLALVVAHGYMYRLYRELL